MAAKQASTEDIPNLVGEWIGYAEGYDPSNGYEKGGDLTLVVAEQNGRAFTANLYVSYS